MKMNALWAVLTLLFSLGLLWRSTRPVAPGQAGRRPGGALLVALIAGSLLMIVGLLTQRSLLLASLSIEETGQTASPAVGWISRFSNLALVVISVPMLLNLLPFNTPIGGDAAKAIGRRLLLVLLFAFTLMFFLSPFASARGGLDRKAIYAFLAMTVMLVSTPEDCRAALRVIKAELAFFCFASLCFIVLDRDRVIAPNYEGILSFIPFRFFGLAPHANAMGPIAGLLLLLEIAVPSGRRSLRAIGFGLGALVLLLAQSKTAMGGVLVGLYATWLATRARRPGGLASAGMSSLLVLGLGASLLLLAISFAGRWDDMLFRLNGLSQKFDLARVSGRADIWREALSEFASHPVFGYGSLIWGDEFRTQVRLNYAFHAHNQFLQTLSESCMVGFVGLMTFLAATVRYLVKAIPATHGASIGLLLVLMTRFFTEAPMKAEATGTGETILLLVVVCFWRIGAEAAASKTVPPLRGVPPFGADFSVAR
jgi:O-antigen ligase